MILSCYLLVLTTGNNTWDTRTYYAKSMNGLNAEQFIIDTRERIKNQQHVPGDLWMMVTAESEKQPLTCVTSFEVEFASEQECDAELDKYLVMETHNVPNASLTCINIADIKEQIRRLRYSLTVHSGLYYDHGVSKISDSEWDAKALQLASLQKKFPMLMEEINFYDSIFSDFTGDTGMHLPWREPGMAEKIYSLGKQWGVLA